MLRLQDRPVLVPTVFGSEHHFSVCVFQSRAGPAEPPASPPQVPLPEEGEEAEIQQILRRNSMIFRVFIAVCLLVCALVLLAILFA